MKKIKIVINLENEFELAEETEAKEEFKEEDLKAGYLVETKDYGLATVFPIRYNGEETLALVFDLKEQYCQQLSQKGFLKKNWNNQNIWATRKD